METVAVQRLVREVRIKLAFNALFGLVCLTIFWGAVAFALLVFLHRLLSPAIGLGWIAAATLAVSVLAALLLALRRIPSPLSAAVAADEVLSLKQKLSSALFLNRMEGPFCDAFRERVEKEAGGVRLAGAFPIRIPIFGKILPVPLLLCGLLLGLMPDLDVFGWQEERKEESRQKEDVEAAAKDLQDRIRRLEKKRELLLFDGAKQVVEDMEQVAALLQRHTVDEKEALSRLSGLEQKLREKRGKDGRAKAVKDIFKPKTPASKSDTAIVKKIRKALKEGGKAKAVQTLFDQVKAMKDAFEGQGPSSEELKKMARDLLSVARAFDLPPELIEKLRKLAKALEQKAGKKGGSDYKNPPPELDFTMEELLDVLSRLDMQDFLDNALDEVEGARQALIERLKICPYCKKNLKHPWEGGTPLPGMGPGGEPGVGYI